MVLQGTVIMEWLCECMVMSPITCCVNSQVALFLYLAVSVFRDVLGLRVT